VNSAARLAWRAVLAIALMVSFYVLALLVVGVLLAIPVVLWSVAKGLLVQVGLFCLIGAFVILKAILPRPDRFDPPGRLLTPDKQPDLFALIRDLAVRTGQDEPTEVYLIADANGIASVNIYVSLNNGALEILRADCRHAPCAH
jgi:hypothetical protein